MPLSTSNSDRPIPAHPWIKILGVALVMPLLVGALLEYMLAAKGFQATTLDTPQLWIEQRARASALGEEALILVGGSRIQLGLDLPLLRETLPLEPVQLAVDGSSSFAVL